MDGTEIGSGTIRPDVVWNPQKGLTPQEIQSTGYREFADFDLSPELIAAVEAASHITPDDLIGRWELRYLEISGNVYYDTPQPYIYFQFFDDNTSEFVAGVADEAVYSTWYNTGENIIITDSSGSQSIGVFKDGFLYFEDAASVMRFERVSTTPTRTQTSHTATVSVVDELVGVWEDKDYGEYLFIGYSDETKQHAYAYFHWAQFEVELTGGEDSVVSGTYTGGGSEPIYVVEINRFENWLGLEVSIYDVSEDAWVYLAFVPADMTVCPYDNPYYVG